MAVSTSVVQSFHTWPSDYRLLSQPHWGLQDPGWDKEPGVGGGRHSLFPRGTRSGSLYGAGGQLPMLYSSPHPLAGPN